MKLMFELPSADRAALDGALCECEKLMYCVPFDILDGNYVDGFLAVTDRKIYKIFGGRIVESFTISGSSGYITECLFGCAALYATFDGKSTMIAQFITGRHLKRYNVLVLALERLASGNDETIESNLADCFCPKCGSPFMKNTSICPNCMDKRETYKKLWGMTKGMRLVMVMPLVFMMLASFVNLFDPILVRYCTDNFIGSMVTPEVREAAGGVNGFVTVALLLIVLNAVTRAFGVLQGRFSAISAGRFSAMLRTIVYEKIQLLSIRSIHHNSTGDLMNRITNDTNVMQSFIVNQIPSLFTQIFMLILYTTLIFFMNWQIAILLIIPIPFAFFIIMQFRTVVRRRNKKAWTLGTRTAHILQDILNGIRIVKSFGTEKKEIERYCGANAVSTAQVESNDKLWATVFPLLIRLMNLGRYALLLVGGYLVYTGIGAEHPAIAVMTLGELMQFSTFANKIFAPLDAMTDLPNTVSNFITSTGKVFEILEKDLEIEDIPLPVDIDFTGDIKIDNVTFGYESYDPVLKNVSLDIKAGEMIGIVGHSGCGKTTLINLLMRLYETDSGKIEIDDVDIRDISQTKLRSQIGVVLQETLLFSGTVRENICYARKDASDEEVIAAARAANAHDFIMKLPDGYNTYVGEKGYSLSGGERQRIAIARAIIHDPKIIVLDEATAALDTETEKLIQEGLDRLSSGRTTIAIAHRLTTLQNADKILVLDKGRVVEYGTHSELMRSKGMYYKLVGAQMLMSGKKIA